MKYTKLNKNWNAEPNAPEPQVKEVGDGVILEFELNPFQFDYIDEGDRGKLEFDNVHIYRLGPTNDEGYFSGQFRYSNDQLPWGEFYELSESDWKDSFPNDKKELQTITKLEEPKHFIFFFRDETFECIADDFYFSLSNKYLDKLDDKYPDGYLDHFIAMLGANHSQIDNDIIQDHCEQYIAFEGKEEFDKLQLEIQDIKSKDDQKLFVKRGNTYQFDLFGFETLDQIIGIIERN